MTESSQAGGELTAFEAWAKKRGNRLDKFGSALGIWSYEDDETQAAFVAWLARATLSAPPADPFREHLATQAENINTERLDKALVLMGVARAGEGQEAFAARLAENVNRLTRAITMHFAAPVAAVAQPVAGWKLVPIKPTPEMLDAAVQRICYGPEGGFTRTGGPQAAWAAMLAASPSCEPSAPEAAPASNWLWRHKKRGGLYSLIGTAKVQTDTPLMDMAEVEIYRSGDGGALWARPVQEFKGRFERANPVAAPAPASEAVAYANPVILLPDEAGEEEWSARVQSHRDDVFSLPLYANERPKAQLPADLPMRIQVSYCPGAWDTFIHGVSGNLTLDSLAAIDASIRDDNAEALFDKGPGDYVLSASYYRGQYGFEGRCEIAPGWELSVESFTPLDAAIDVALQTAEGSAA